MIEEPCTCKEDECCSKCPPKDEQIERHLVRIKELQTYYADLYTKQKQQSMTYGQKAVGLSFNPSNDDAVGKAKQTCADAIDQMNELRNSTTSGEVKRMASVAITELQTAQMWMVKAITWKD
jgi:hypothetical protein